MFTVNVDIFVPPQKFVSTQETVDIYKCFDSENTIRQLPKIQENSFENVSDYNLINVKEAYDLMKKGKKLSAKHKTYANVIDIKRF